VKEECLSKVVLIGERSLQRALSEYLEYFHAERNHQGKGNVLLCPRDTDVHREGPVEWRERLGGGDLLDKLLIAHGGEHFKVFEAVQRHRAFPICLARASVNCATASIAAADRRRHHQPGQDLGGSDLGGGRNLRSLHDLPRFRP